MFLAYSAYVANSSSHFSSAVKSAPAGADRRDMDLSAIALPGLQQADAQLQAAEVRIASFGSASPGGAGLDTVDLNAEVAARMSAKNQSLASLIPWKTAAEIQKSVIDLMA